MHRLTLAVVALAFGAFASAGPTGRASWPRLTVLRMAKPPTIDGTLAPGEWAGATPLTGFARFRSERLGPRQPRVWLAWSDACLLVAVEVPVPPGRKVRANTKSRDGDVWRDDSVEVHVDRGHRHKGQTQFVVNALGTQLDGREGDKAYNAAWTAAASIAKDAWRAELAIPWKATGGPPPKPGQLDGLNVAFNGPCVGGVLSWSPVRRSLHEAGNYAHLVYGTTLAAGLTRLDPARLDAAEGLVIGNGKVPVTLTLSERSKEGRSAVLTETTRTIEAPGRFALPIRIPRQQGFPVPGEYTLELRGEPKGTRIWTHRAAVTIGPPLALTVQAFIRENYLNVKAALEPSSFAPRHTTVRLRVDGPKDIVLDESLTPDPKTGIAQRRIDGARVPVGKLTVRATATRRPKGRAYTVEKTLDSPLRPPWLGTRVGISDEVMPPWTPLAVEGDAVKPWGRTYRFARSLLPTEVVTRGASVLAGPIALGGRANGKDVVWQPLPDQATSHKPAVVVIGGGAESDSLRLRGTATIEYDGMVRVDLTLAPKGATTLERLWLDVPLKPKHARYLYHFPGRWGSVANSGHLPPEGWAHAFKPFVWLGDDDRGFAWFCESDQHWRPADPDRAITITRTPKATVLRLHLIEQPMKFDRALSYTFGFQATPVKKPEKTVWDYRICHHGAYGVESRPAVSAGRIVYPAARHLRAEQGTFECWYQPAFDTERTTPRTERKHQGNRGLFAVRWAGNSNCGLYWNWWVQGLVAWSRDQGKVTHYQQAPFDWKAGEWHHIAMTWGDAIRIYIDGKLLSTKPTPGFFPHDLADAEIEIGGTQPLATVDDVRILRVARPPTASPGAHRPDADTLLLDPFDGYGKPGARTPGQADSTVKFGPARFGQGAVWTPGKALTHLEWLASLGVRTLCFHEHWSPYQSYPYVTDANRPRLKSLVEGCHKRGVNLLLYMARSFSNIAPDWELRSDECLIAPRRGGYHRKPEQRAYTMCWRSPRKDFCLYHLAKMLDEFGHDGWYLDGSEWPVACTNRHHGCGYIAPDGTVRPTYDIFATRDFMKRLYVLTRRRRPHGQINIHNSTVMTIPTLAWGTSTWGGEQLDTHKAGSRTLDILPMDAFRTEFMGRQWGVPAEFLVYERRPYTSKHMLAYTLLHGVLIRPSPADALARISALWKVYDAFPFGDAEMLPYWNNAHVLTCTPKGIYATAYRRPGEGLLLFVSNLGDADAQATVTLNAKRLGWKGAWRAWDALSGEAIAVADGAIRLPIGSWEYRVVRAR